MGLEVKNPVRTQSKYGKMGSSAKTGEFFWRVTGAKRCTFWIKNIKVPFGIGRPHLHIKPRLYVCRRAQGSQIFKQN